MSPMGLKIRVGCLMCTTELYAMYIPWYPLLVLHVGNSLTVSIVDWQFKMTAKWDHLCVELNPTHMCSSAMRYHVSLLGLVLFKDLYGLLHICYMIRSRKLVCECRKYPSHWSGSLHRIPTKWHLLSMREDKGLPIGSKRLDVLPICQWHLLSGLRT